MSKLDRDYGSRYKHFNRHMYIDNRLSDSEKTTCKVISGSICLLIVLSIILTLIGNSVKNYYKDYPYYDSFIIESPYYVVYSNWGHNSRRYYRKKNPRHMSEQTKRDYIDWEFDNCLKGTNEIIPMKDQHNY